MVDFHGSPHRLEPGTVLRPGVELDPPRSTNGADSTAVYASSSEGYRLVDIYEPNRLGAETCEEYAVRNAFLWGSCCEDEHQGPTFVHVIEPLGNVEWDPLAVSPADQRMPAARVIAVFEADTQESAVAQYFAWIPPSPAPERAA